MDSTCSKDEVCIESQFGLAKPSPDDARVDEFFNFSYGYANLRTDPNLKMDYDLGQWNDMMHREFAPDTYEVFDRSLCTTSNPRYNPNNVLVAMDDPGCMGEFKATLARHPDAKNLVSKFRQSLSERFDRSQIVSPAGMHVFDESCLNIVLHIRRGDSPGYRRDGDDFFISAIRFLEQLFSSSANGGSVGDGDDGGINFDFLAPEHDAMIRGIQQRKEATCSSSVRNYWIHTDSKDIEGMELEFTTALGFKQHQHDNIALHFIGKGAKQFSALDAMGHMYVADVLIPSYSTFSVSMGFANGNGVVIYNKDETEPNFQVKHYSCGVVQNVTHRHRNSAFCGFLYTPMTNDPLGSWADGLGNWIGIPESSSTELSLA